MKSLEYLGLQCVEITNNWLTLWVTESVGPRIIALMPKGGGNFFVSLPEATIKSPGKGQFHLYGGHRLWHAPEDPRRTYVPDDEPVEIIPDGDGIRARQSQEPDTGIQKEIRVQLHPDAAMVEVEHILTNQGLWPVILAPWAITQMKPGGVALLPLYQGLIEDNPTLPNRSITLWPYTDVNSPNINWGNDIILVESNMKAGALKLGFPNPRGWLAYWIDGFLFIKRAAFDPDREYFDFGSSSECYCNDQFLELETLGPKTTLQPGASTVHIETWEVISDITWTEDYKETLALIERATQEEN
jgi:hypothetical protein